MVCKDRKKARNRLFAPYSYRKIVRKRHVAALVYQPFSHSGTVKIRRNAISGHIFSAEQKDTHKNRGHRHTDKKKKNSGDDPVMEHSDCFSNLVHIIISKQ